MADAIDWKRLLDYRRMQSGEPDAESLRRLIEMWRQRLAADSDFGEDELDTELVKLLEKIHHAF